MHVHWNYAVSNHCAQLPKHAINDCWRTYEVGRWAPATGPRKMLIAQRTKRIFLPNRRLLCQCFDEKITMGIGMTCSTTKGPQACHACSTRSLYRIIAKRCPICFDRLAKQHHVGKRENSTTTDMITRDMCIIESVSNLAQGTPGIRICRERIHLHSLYNMIV